MVLEIRVFEFSDDLFLHFAKSEFSKLGVSVKTSVVIDEEHLRAKAGAAFPVRRTSVCWLPQKTWSTCWKESLEKNGKFSFKIEYQEYTVDLKVIPDLIRCIESNKYTHLNRMG